MLKSLLSVGAAAYHFGNAVDLTEILEKVPKDVIIMGNIDPVGVLKFGTPQSIRDNVLSLMEKCSKYSNFIVSSGCDIPPNTPWENIEAFFNAVDEFNKNN